MQYKRNKQCWRRIRTNERKKKSKIGRKRKRQKKRNAKWIEMFQWEKNEVFHLIISEWTYSSLEFLLKTRPSIKSVRAPNSRIYIKFKRSGFPTARVILVAPLCNTFWAFYDSICSSWLGCARLCSRRTVLRYIWNRFETTWIHDDEKWQRQRRTSERRNWGIGTQQSNRINCTLCLRLWQSVWKCQNVITCQGDDRPHSIISNISIKTLKTL